MTVSEARDILRRAKGKLLSQLYMEGSLPLVEEALAVVRRADRRNKKRKVRDLEAMVRTLLLYVGHIPNDGTKMFAAVKAAQELLVTK